MLDIKNITFSYENKEVISDVSFSVFPGQNVAVIGESGCGKSTLLKLIYGQYDLDQGTIFYNEKAILGPKYNLIPGPDYMKYLAQDFDLMPYSTVAENVGKFLSNMFPKEKKARIQELLDMVEMSDFAQVKPKYLSGGQQQRVALARVLALEPEILLLDEPFSQIDSFRKNSLRRNLFRYLKDKGIACIIATHDSTDALSFADETIILQQGKIIKKGPSSQEYNYPVNKYVASLFGEVNELKSQLVVPNSDPNEMMLVYSHQLLLCDKSPLKARVQNNYFRGSHFLIEAFLENGDGVFFEHFESIAYQMEVHLKLK